MPYERTVHRHKTWQLPKLTALSLTIPLYNLEEQTIQLFGEDRMSQMLEIEKLFNTVFEMKMEEKENEQIQDILFLCFAVGAFFCARRHLLKRDQKST